MGSISNVLSSPMRPISVSEFAKSLCRVLSIGKLNHDGKHGTVGLAISGGVDSMALAVLCSKIQALPPVHHEDCPEELQSLKTISFKAFIVDHQVRPSSYEEAKSVSNILEERGIKSDILKINWPEDLYSTNFESLARKHRFRLLGKACLERGINSLLLAHHEDDQVETIMMRLMAGHRGTGLVGIKEGGGIPECYGIHGVYESGGPESSNSAEYPQQSAWKTSVDCKQLDMETGGIRIYRPMLGFSKDRLIATCKHEKMEWFEDHTNKDPALTKRNAIRHMYNYHQMPAALSKPALIDLSQRIKDSMLQEDSLVSQLQMETIKNLDTCVGTAKVEFPPARIIQATSEAQNLNHRRIAAKLLRRVLFLVSPLEHIELSSLDNSITKVFPGLSSSEESTPPKQFTVASVYLQPQQPTEQYEETEWLLSRQPYHKTLDNPSISLSPTEINAWTPWHLYDGRFWTRIQPLDPNVLSFIIRPFQRSDFMKFRYSLRSQDQRAFVGGLRESAGGNIRYTLPALVAHDMDGEEHFLALPTLCFQAEIAGSLVKWEVRYKKSELTETQSV